METRSRLAEQDRSTAVNRTTSARIASSGAQTSNAVAAMAKSSNRLNSGCMRCHGGRRKGSNRLLDFDPSRKLAGVEVQ